MGSLATARDLSAETDLTDSSETDEAGDFEEVRQLGMRYLQDAKKYKKEFLDIEACFAEGADFFKKIEELSQKYVGDSPRIRLHFEFPERFVEEAEIASAEDISELEQLTEAAWEILQAVHVMRHKESIKFNLEKGIGVAVESSNAGLCFRISEKVGRAICKLLYSDSMAMPGQNGQNVAGCVGFLREGYEDVQKGSFKARMRLLQAVLAKDLRSAGISVKMALAEVDVSRIL